VRMFYAPGLRGRAVGLLGVVRCLAGGGARRGKDKRA
jgi:hypothetical protein